MATGLPLTALLQTYSRWILYETRLIPQSAVDGQIRWTIPQSPMQNKGQGLMRVGAIHPLEGVVHNVDGIRVRRVSLLLINRYA